METTTEVKLSPELRKKLDAAAQKSKRRRFWEPWEDQVLRDYYSKLTPRELTKYILGRSAHAIHCRAVILGLSRECVVR